MRIKNIKETRLFTFQDERKTRASEPISGSTSRNISGYFAVFNQPSKLIAEMDDGQMRTFYEVLMPESFNDALSSPSLDCIFCVDHNPEKIISRTKSGTLTIKVDDYGVYAESQTPDTTVSRDLIANIQFKNYSENSFCFTVDDQDEVWEQKGGDLYRYIKRLSGLYDLSSVVTPAYNGTSLSVRGKEELKKRSEAVTEAPVEAPKTEVHPEEKQVQPPINDMDAIELEIFLMKSK